jgi:hypothetical protein
MHKSHKLYFLNCCVRAPGLFHAPGCGLEHRGPWKTDESVEGSMGQGSDAPMSRGAFKILSAGKVSGQLDEETPFIVSYGRPAGTLKG